MKVHFTDSELWWLANGDEIRSPRSIPLQKTLDVLKETFHFFEMPTKVPTGTDGFAFKFGSFFDGTDLINLRELVVYNAACHISVAGSTDLADKVFGKLTEIFLGLGVRNPTTPPVKFYRSTLVCDFDRPFDSVFSKYAAIIGAIQGKGCLPDVAIQTSGIAFSADPTLLPPAMMAYNPTLFSINRRTDVTFSTNRFTCFANMQTDEHLAALEAIERLI